MTKQELFICIDEEDNLHSIEWDKEDNEERNSFSLCGSEYEGLISEEEGKKEAFDRLKEPEYWEDMGMLKDDCFLKDFINWEEVAEYVISSDGWENINGDCEYFGEIDTEARYFNLSGCGQHDSWKDTKILHWLIPKDKAMKLLELWGKYHLKKSKKAMETTEQIFNEFKELTDRQVVLNKYVKAINEVE